MSTHPTGASIQGSLAKPQDDARLALQRIMQATRANLAEMDRLLIRAERLLSHGCCDFNAGPMPDQSAGPV